ncbi:MAG: ThuA domain-containing protein [Tannerellaceae bacterium]|jgi:type 1 glutamine amidotransferase|nr:ThuA domain-containing protein [Tannerellaceae bacterium]
MKKTLLILFALLCSLVTFPQKIKTMIITGQDGSHWWKGGSEAIKMILDNSNLFSVDILTTPARGESMESYRPDFRKYNLVVFNYGGETLVEAVRKDFEQFVANGGGVVIIHSSIIPMENWPEYNMMAGLGAWNGRNEKDGPYVYWKNDRWVYDYSPGWAGYHGLQHPFTVVHRDTLHPITRGLPPVWEHFKDELYARLRGPAMNMTMLATAYETASDGVGRDEPVLWTVNYGKGRVFVSVLGHAGNDPELRYSMECAGFQVTLLRGSEWAATGKVTQDVPYDFPSKDIISLRRSFTPPKLRMEN